MKVDELEGAQLAAWVARAQGFTVLLDGAGLVVDLPFAPWVASFEEFGYRPDMNWSQGGPLLDKYEVIIGRAQSSDYEVVRDQLDGSAMPGRRQDRKYAIARMIDTEAKYRGNTALIAGMRAIVASVYGSEVPDA